MYAIVLEYVHRSGPSQIRLSWESESQPRTVLPPSVLFGPERMRRRATRI